MLNIPVEIKEKLKTNTAPKNFRVTFPNGERADIINDNIVFESVRFTESVMSQDKFKLGLCESPVIEFEVFGIENIKGKKIECYYEIYCEDTVDDAVYREDLDAYVYPIPLGVFYVDSCKKEAKMNMRRVIAYGLQAYFDWKIPYEAIGAIYTRGSWLDLNDYIALSLQSLVLADATRYDVDDPYIRTERDLLFAFSSWRYKGIIFLDAEKDISFTKIFLKQQGTSTYIPLSRTFTNEIYHFYTEMVTSRWPYDYGRIIKYERLNASRDMPKILQDFSDFTLNYKLSGDRWRVLEQDDEWTTITGSELNFRPFDQDTLGEYKGLIGQGLQLIRGHIDVPFRTCDMRFKAKLDYLIDDLYRYAVPSNIVLQVYVEDNNGNKDLIYTPQSEYSGISLGTIYDTCSDAKYSDLRAELDAVMEVVYETDWINGNTEDNWQSIEAQYRPTKNGKNINPANPPERKVIEEYVSDTIELKGKMGKFNRIGELEVFDLDTTTLVPNDTDLVPSMSLVPNGADVDTINPSEYETAWYDDDLSLPYGACAANHKVSGTDTYTIVYADGYNANTDTSTYQIYDISNNDLVKEMTVEEITPILTTIITNLSNLRYMPSDIDMVGRPDIEAGDGIQVMSNSGAFNTYVLSRTIDGIQGLSDTITAK